MSIRSILLLLFFSVMFIPMTVTAQSPGEEQPNDASLQSFNDEPGQRAADKDVLHIDAVEISTTAVAQRSALILAVKEAEFLFNQANKSFTKGNTAKAQDLYDQSLRKLSQANLDAAVLNALRDDFKSLFAKLNNSLNVGNRTTFFKRTSYSSCSR